MPWRRKEPWFTVYGQPTDNRAPFTDRVARFGNVMRRTGLMIHSNGRYLMNRAYDEADTDEPYDERVATIQKDMRAYGPTGAHGALMSVLGRRSRFRAAALHWRARNVSVSLGYDGVDFYVAPNGRLLASMIENLTVRDGGEPNPIASPPVVRYYELGGVVVQLVLKKFGGTIAIGRLWPDGTFTVEANHNGDPLEMSTLYGLDAALDYCVHERRGTGEKCFRTTAENETYRLWSFVEATGGIPGVTVLFGGDGVILGRRLEWKYGSILPGLGGLRRKARRRA